MKIHLLIALCVAVMAASGCVDAPDADYHAVELHDAPSLAAEDLTVRRDGVERTVRDGTLRVRSRHCFGVGSGSGFAVTDRILVTNRHVVDGADVVQVSTWDGTSIDVDITGIATTNDLAVVATRQHLPQVLPQAGSPQPGTSVAAVGYPGGDTIAFSWGRVVDYVDGTAFDETGSTMRITADVIPGNSGGPLVDEDGNVVGVVFAIEKATGYGLAIPVESLQATAETTTGFFSNPSPC